MLPPLISSTVSFWSRAFSASCCTSIAICVMFFWSALRITGTSRPRSVSTATPTLHVLLVDDLAALGVDRGVELRELLHRRRQHLHQHRGDGEVAARLLDLLPVLLPQLLERGHVGLVELGDVRNRVPGVAEVLGRRPADVAPRLTLDLAPLLRSRAAAPRRGPAGRRAAAARRCRRCSGSAARAP